MADTERLSPRPSALDEDAFVACYGDVYEHSPWIARQAHRAGLSARDDIATALAARLAAVFDAAEASAQLAVLRAHPDLAGKLAVGEALTADSSAEQAGAGLDQCTVEEFERFQALNAAYRARFDFPFIVAVRGLHRREILQAFEARLSNDAETERTTAVAQVNRIARLRLLARAGG
ncbi:2-oxo-4-hydroxy-4-carboxy-5-ureidoimidazoline decarboxylase [Alloalcanivorax sp. C16-1]|uniref:2-oxo-4-hydroxy-4-carboxy-5-ureidoimidazoline decarboxylase n=1 Tax=Alloalcanivorax sp. C16-1 TaxID=3390051 RepID=UPI0039707F8E